MFAVKLSRLLSTNLTSVLSVSVRHWPYRFLTLKRFLDSPNALEMNTPLIIQQCPHMSETMTLLLERHVQWLHDQGWLPWICIMTNLYRLPCPSMNDFNLLLTIRVSLDFEIWTLSFLLVHRHVKVILVCSLLASFPKKQHQLRRTYSGVLQHRQRLSESTVKVKMCAESESLPNKFIHIVSYTDMGVIVLYLRNVGRSCMMWHCPTSATGREKTIMQEDSWHPQKLRSSSRSRAFPSLRSGSPGWSVFEYNLITGIEQALKIVATQMGLELSISFRAHTRMFS